MARLNLTASLPSVIGRASVSRTSVSKKEPNSDSAQIVQTHPDWWTDLDSKAVDTARLLAADAVQKVGN